MNKFATKAKKIIKDEIAKAERGMARYVGENPLSEDYAERSYYYYARVFDVIKEKVQAVQKEAAKNDGDAAAEIQKILSDFIPKRVQMTAILRDMFVRDFAEFAVRCVSPTEKTVVFHGSDDAVKRFAVSLIDGDKNLSEAMRKFRAYVYSEANPGVAG